MFYEQTSTGIILRVRVSPNSSKCGIVGIFTDSNNQSFLKIGLNAVPEKGKANQELIRFLSKQLKQNKSSFSIISGETDRYKRILIQTEDRSPLEAILNDWKITYDSNNT